MNKLAETGAALIGGAVHHVEAIHGGDLSEIQRIALADGRDAIVKNGPAPKTEAAMLSAIAASGAPAPAVLAVSDEALVDRVTSDRGQPEQGLGEPRPGAGQASCEVGGALRLADGLCVRTGRDRERLDRRLAAFLGRAPAAGASRSSPVRFGAPRRGACCRPSEPIASATDTCASPRRSMGRQHIGGWRPGQRIDRSGLLPWPYRGRPRNARLVRPTRRRLL